MWFGFFAFNGVSEGGIIGEGYDVFRVARAVINTGLAGAGGILASLFTLKLGLDKPQIIIFGKELRVFTIFGGFWSVSGAINGGLSGMVAICASANAVETWAAVVIGVVAGKNFILLRFFFQHFNSNLFLLF